MLQQVKGKAQDLRVGIQETKRQMDLVKNDNNNNDNMNMNVNSMEGATTNGNMNANAMGAPEALQQQQQYVGGGQMQQEFESNDGNNIPVGL